jgi:hypothetical protein
MGNDKPADTSLAVTPSAIEVRFRAASTISAAERPGACDPNPISTTSAVFKQCSTESKNFRSSRCDGRYEGIYMVETVSMEHNGDACDGITRMLGVHPSNIGRSNLEIKCVSKTEHRTYLSLQTSWMKFSTNVSTPFSPTTPPSTLANEY